MGIQIIDPIEVYYLPGEDTFYPIISKSGCSSIKLMLIRRFAPDFESKFPHIHHINPAKHTDNKVQRLTFHRMSQYEKWAAGKKMIFVMRDPLARTYSCFLDVQTDKNTMYKFPSGLNWIIRFKQTMPFDQFLQKVCSLSDRMSDRHFRSQSFYINRRIQNTLENIEMYTLPEFMKMHKNDTSNSSSKAARINTNPTSISAELRAELNNDPDFRDRYATDLRLYAAIEDAN